MEYQKMTSIQTEIEEYTSYQKAKKATETHVRLVMQNRKLVTLPKEVMQLNHIPYLELDISYNKTCDFAAVLEQLKHMHNLKGIALIKNNMGTLPVGIAQLKNLESLVLWNNGLTDLPASIGELTQLKYLHLRTNNLHNIPAPVFELKALQYLCLRNNKIKQLPDALFSLTQLQHLDISNCGISEIPAAIGQLTELRVLEISGNKLQALPRSLAALTKLEKIVFKNNKGLQLDDVFEILKTLPALKQLDLSDYGITHLPASIAAMQQVESINLSGNQLTDLPDLSALPGLTSININGNPQLPVRVYLKAIAGIPSITSLENYQLEALPDEIGLCTHLEEITLGGNLTFISPEIGKLKNLKKLMLSVYGDVKPLDIPDVFDQLSLLEFLYVTHNNLNNVPASLYHSPSITTLSWACNLTLDFTQLAGMAKLESLSTGVKDNAGLEQIARLRQLKAVHLSNPDITTLPQSFVHMEQLTQFHLGGFLALDVEDALNKLPYLENVSLTNNGLDKIPASLHTLKNIKTLYIAYNIPISFLALVNLVKQCPGLQELECTITDTDIPGNITILNRLQSCKIHYRQQQDIANNNSIIPLEFGLLNFDTIRLLQYKSSLSDKIAAVKKIKELNLITDEQKMIAFGVFTGAFEQLKDKLHDPFAGQASLKDKNIFIFGKPTLSSLKELQDNLKNRGAVIAKKLDDKVTHILLTSQFKEDIAPVLLSGKPIILEDFIKKQVFEEDKPYLMAADNDELTDQISRLLRSEEEDNIALALQLIEGGGANKRLTAYLMAIHLVHDDIEIRKKARNLFRKFASAEIQTHLKNKWKDSYRGKDYSTYITQLIHPEIDVFDYLFAEHMTRLHLSKAKSGNYHEYYFKRLHLRGIPFNVLPSSFKFLDFITDIHFEGLQHFDIDKSYPNFCNLNLKSFSLRDCKIDRFPEELLRFQDLETLSLGGTYSAERVCLDIPLLEPHAKLQILSIYNFDINQPENLRPIAVSLKNLQVTNSNLTQIPLFTAACNKLTNINFADNPIDTIDLDFSKFPQLEYLSLYNCPVKKLPDTFYGCGQLHDISLSNMQLTEVPFSLFTVGKNYGSIYLRLEANQIATISGIPDQVNKTGGEKLFNASISYLNFSDNRLKDIPAFFASLQCNDLVLSKNPIENIPANIAQFKSSRIALDETNITRIPIEIFSSTANISVSSKNNIELPPVDSIPMYHGYKSFYTHNETEDFKLQREAIRKKLIVQSNEY